VPNKVYGRAGTMNWFSVSGPVSLTMTLAASRDGYWKLDQLTLNKITVTSEATTGYIPKIVSVDTPMQSSKRSLQYMNMQSVTFSSYACVGTQAAFYQIQNRTEADDTQIAVGIAFKNIQVAFSGVSYVNGQAKFGRYVDDCIGTFSVGSLMGVIVGLVLASVFLFGFLMLNSVQTMDRFDDPKQKQILINVKE